MHTRPSLLARKALQCTFLCSVALFAGWHGRTTAANALDASPERARTVTPIELPGDNAESEAPIRARSYGAPFLFELELDSLAVEQHGNWESLRGEASVLSNAKDDLDLSYELVVLNSAEEVVYQSLPSFADASPGASSSPLAIQTGKLPDDTYRAALRVAGITTDGASHITARYVYFKVKAGSIHLVDEDYWDFASGNHEGRPA